MSAATATTRMPFPTSSGFRPACRARRVSRMYAAASPTAYAMPYHWTGMGPIRNATGSGVRSSITGECIRRVRIHWPPHGPPTRTATASRHAPQRVAPAVNAEFNWWLLIVGLVIGAALVYLVLADSSRRESDVAAEELPREAAWISSILNEEGDPIAPET